MTRHLVPALLGVVLLTACGGKELGAPVATTNVEMAKSYRFEPDVVEIRAGQTVTWTNNDNFTHTVEVEGRDDHEVGKGRSFSVTFDEPGTYDYVCTLHSHDMRGRVIVR